MNLCPNKPLPVLLVVHASRHRSPNGLSPHWPWIAFLLGTALGWLIAHSVP